MCPPVGRGVPPTGIRARGWKDKTHNLLKASLADDFPGLMTTIGNTGGLSPRRDGQAASLNILLDCSNRVMSSRNSLHATSFRPLLIRPYFSRPIPRLNTSRRTDFSAQHSVPDGSSGPLIQGPLAQIAAARAGRERFTPCVSRASPIWFCAGFPVSVSCGTVQAGSRRIQTTAAQRVRVCAAFLSEALSQHRRILAGERGSLV